MARLSMMQGQTEMQQGWLRWRIDPPLAERVNRVALPGRVYISKVADTGRYRPVPITGRKCGIGQCRAGVAPGCSPNFTWRSVNDTILSPRQGGTHRMTPSTRRPTCWRQRWLRRRFPLRLVRRGCGGGTMIIIANVEEFLKVHK
jgi:hypothetical protein